MGGRDLLGQSDTEQQATSPQKSSSSSSNTSLPRFSQSVQSVVATSLASSIVCIFGDWPRAVEVVEELGSWMEVEVRDSAGVC